MAIDIRMRDSLSALAGKAKLIKGMCTMIYSVFIIDQSIEIEAFSNTLMIRLNDTDKPIEFLMADCASSDCKSAAFGSIYAGIFFFSILSFAITVRDLSPMNKI